MLLVRYHVSMLQTVVVKLASAVTFNFDIKPIKQLENPKSSAH